jgi:NADH-quinone oxidoreductase subunit E
MTDGPSDVAAGALQEQFDRLRDAYPPQMSASLVLPLLQIVQQQKGHVTAADAGLVAHYAGVPSTQVIEALSWYTMLHRQPVGRHVVKVCRNIACALRGSDRLLAHIEKKLGVAPGGTTADGRFTFLAVECLASCGTAPVMQVDETYHERLDEATIDRVLEELR